MNSIRKGLRKALKGARSRDKVALRRGVNRDSRRAIIKGRGWLYN